MKALVTGATSGIGMSIAKKLSKRGWDLILTGRKEEILRKMKAKFGKNTEIIVADLAKKEDVFRVYEFCKDKDVDMLVNNAGYGLFGKCEDIDLEDELNTLGVNITALHILTKLFLRDFKKRDHGIILNVASAAGFMSGPLMSSYYASKNYVVRLTLAIYEELRRDRSGVTVTMLCPGPVATDFNNRAGVRFSVSPISADMAAECALKNALAGKLFAIPSLGVKLGVFGAQFIPHRLLSAIVYNIQHGKLKDGDSSR